MDGSGRAEDRDNISIVRSVNVEGTKNIANACKKLDCKNDIYFY